MLDWLITIESWLSKVAAYLGAGLGIYSTVRSLRQDRFRLDLRVLAVIGDFSMPAIIIRATNIGRIPATVTSLGFSLLGTNNVFFPDPEKRLQREDVCKLLTPGECVSLYIGLMAFSHPSWGMIHRPVARISDGRLLYGKKVPKQLRNDPMSWVEEQTKIG